MNAINTATTSVVASAQTGSIVFLAAGIALVRAALVVVGAVSLGAMAQVFFPEMLVLPNNPMALLAIVALDTFAVVAGVLMARSKAATQKSR